MQIEVTTQLTTCYCCKFEGEEFSRSLESFILLLSACFFMVGLDEFSGVKVWWASPASKHAAHSDMMLRPVAADFFRGTGLTWKWFAPPIRQNGRKREGEGGLLEGRYLLSLVAVFRISESRPLLRRLYPCYSICIPPVPDCVDSVLRAITFVAENSKT